MKGKFNILAIQTLIATRGIEVGGRVQKFIDSEVMRTMDAYMPSDSTDMRKSVTRHTKVGSGEIKVVTPYARRRLFEARSKGLRGPHYFERNKVDNKTSILNGALKIAGGKK